MNIRELKKLAEDHDDLEDLDLWSEWPEHWPEEQRTFKYMNLCRRAKRQYVACCCAGFVDALVYLRGCRALLADKYPDYDPRHPSQWLDQQLKKLEEVEP